MSPALQLIVQLVSIVLGAAATLTCGVMLMYLKGIKATIDSHATRMSAFDKQLQNLSVRTAEYATDFVVKEDWVRSEGYTRKELKDITATLSRMEGKLDVTEKLPEICGQIAREIVKQSKENLS